MAPELTGTDPVVVTIAAGADLIHVRQVLRAQALEAGLGLVDQTKLITAGSELARNIVTYATGSRGTLRAEQVRADGRRGVRATFSDSGPGIDDIELALTDGFSTARSLGLGLPGARRLTDELTITSAKGTGTTVVIVKWAR
ncbi:ATP-binding protein [Planomonospora corallina]|uniref:ATP-binding protein n=1 Tax=Planomonospora corallina TaxID=1806052 RepID=A0ABV8IB92_9ACTN